MTNILIAAATGALLGFLGQVMWDLWRWRR